MSLKEFLCNILIILLFYIAIFSIVRAREKEAERQKYLKQMYEYEKARRVPVSPFRRMV